MQERISFRTIATVVWVGGGALKQISWTKDSATAAVTLLPGSEGFRFENLVAVLYYIQYKSIGSNELHVRCTTVLYKKKLATASPASILSIAAFARKQPDKPPKHLERNMKRGFLGLTDEYCICSRMNTLFTPMRENFRL